MDARNFTHEERASAVAEICELISQGKSVRSILGDGRPEHLPGFKFFLQWISENEEWGKQYARAMELRAEVLFEQMLEISDNPEVGIIEETGTTKDGTFTKEKRYDAVEHRRLKVDTRKWILSRMNPKKYGDRVMTEDVTVKPKELIIIKPIERE